MMFSNDINELRRQFDSIEPSRAQLDRLYDDAASARPASTEPLRMTDAKLRGLLALAASIIIVAVVVVQTDRSPDSGAVATATSAGSPTAIASPAHRVEHADDVVTLAGSILNLDVPKNLRISLGLPRVEISETWTSFQMTLEMPAGFDVSIPDLSSVGL